MIISEMRKYFFVLFFLVPVFLFAGGQKEKNLPASMPPEDQTAYMINNIDIQVDGQTKPFAIQDTGNIKSGTLIYGEANLAAYIAEKRQFLISARVFEESSLEYTLGNPDAENRIPVDLFIVAKDTSNFIMYPSPNYDSNEGLVLTLSLHDFNFFGTMTPVEMELGYKQDTDGNNGFVLESEIALPFKFAGFIWTLDFANTLEVLENTEVKSNNQLGLLVDIPHKETTLTFGIYESIYANEENYEREKPLDGEYFRDVWYMNTTALAKWHIPTGFMVASFGELEYTPEVDFSINYRPGGAIGDSRRGFEITFKQMLGFGKLNWLGNFREGLIANIENSNTYNIESGNWDNQLFLTGTYHKKFTDWTGFSGRIRWAQWFNRYYDGSDVLRGIPHKNDAARDVIRGIPNENIAADFMLSLNLQESFRLIRFTPSKWFNDPRWRILDFEETIDPFIDLALVQDPLHHRSFSFEDMIVTGGLELTTYPFSFQSTYFRISFGVDLRELFTKGLDSLAEPEHRELYVGLGHSF